MSTTSLNDLAVEIEHRFRDEELPPRPVTPHPCEECATVDELIGGRTWQTVAADFPEYCHDVFPLLSPPAKRYYLPAFMTVSLNRPEWISGQSVAFAIERGEILAESLSGSQRSTVLRWLEVLELSDEAFPRGIHKVWIDS